MFSHTSANIVQSRNRVGGEGTFVDLAGAQVSIAWFEDEGRSLVEGRLGSTITVLVSDGRSGTKFKITVEDELADLLRNPVLNQELVCSSSSSE